MMRNLPGVILRQQRGDDRSDGLRLVARRHHDIDVGTRRGRRPAQLRTRAPESAVREEQIRPDGEHGERDDAHRLKVPRRRDGLASATSHVIIHQIHIGSSNISTNLNPSRQMAADDRGKHLDVAIDRR